MRGRSGGARTAARRMRVAAALVVAGTVGGSVGYAAPGAKSPTVCAQGCPFTTIQAAVEAAQPGAVVTIGPGTYAGGVSIDKDLTLAGAGAKKTVIAGPPDAAVVEAVTGEVVLRDLTVSGGEVGVEISLFPRVTIRDSVVAGNTWGTRGFGGSITISRSLVTGSSIAGVGPIFSGSVTVEDSIVAANPGAGVRGDTRMTVIVRNSRILDNGDSGIWMPGGTLEVRGSLIRGNSGSFGGGIALLLGRAGSSATVVDSTIRDNTASAHGGGVFIGTQSTLELRGTKVTKNRALAGGGIFNGNDREPGFVAVSSRIWNNRPDDYVEGCDATAGLCDP